MHRPRQATPARRRIIAPAAECPLNKPDSPALLDALDCIMHYHTDHSGDHITIWCFNVSDDEQAPKVVHVIASDQPELMDRLQRFLKTENASQTTPAASIGDK